MTTPHQDPPDGSFTVGGGGSHYGQDISEQYARELWRVPSPTLTTAIPQLLDVLRMAPTGSLSSIQEMIPGANPEEEFYKDEVSADAIIDNLDDNWFQRTWKAFAQAMSGGSELGNTIDDFFNGAWKQKKEQDQIAAAVGQIQSDLRANNNSGLTFQVPVNEYTGVPSVFDLEYSLGSGTVTNDGDTLELSNDDLLVAYRYTPAALLTDYFEVSLGVPRQAGRYFGSYNERSLLFIGRASDDFEDLCLARLNGDELQIGCVSGGLDDGTYTWFGSGFLGSGPTTVTINPGSYMTFRGGTFLGVRVFQFLVNNQVVATFTDDDEVSLAGDNYRWTGFGIWNDANDLFNRAPNVSHFVANDNAPAPILGTGARMVRTSTSGVGVTSGVNPLPSNFFDLPAEVSETITVDLLNGVFVVAEADWYTMTFRSAVSSSFPNHLQFRAHINGIAGPYGGGDHMFGNNALGGTIIPDAVSAVVQVYLNAGDEVGWSYESDGLAAPCFRGEATGYKTYASIVRGK